MTDATEKETFTLTARANVDRLSRRPPAYMDAFKRGEGPLDDAKGGFPWEVPSEMFFQALRDVDLQLDQIQIQLDFMRQGVSEMRRVAVLPREEPQPDVPVAAPSARAIAAGTKQRETATVPEPPAPPVIEDPTDLNGLPPGEYVVEGRAETEIKRQTVTVVVSASDWTCPEHGGFAEAVSRKGRQYRYCTKCGETERLAAL